MCAAAHMFDHDCYEAPKPWLSPPTGPKQPPPTELGEEGLFGFIPWSWVRYGIIVLSSYLLYHTINAFVDFRCAFFQADYGSCTKQCEHICELLCIEALFCEARWSSGTDSMAYFVPPT